jgi:hypothetical protein
LKRVAFPFNTAMGSVHSDLIAGRAEVYDALQPLQSRSFVALGATEAEAAAGAANASKPATTPSISHRNVALR